MNQSTPEMPNAMTEEEKQKMLKAAEAAKKAVAQNAQMPPIQTQSETMQADPAAQTEVEVPITPEVPTQNNTESADEMQSVLQTEPKTPVTTSENEVQIGNQPKEEMAAEPTETAKEVPAAVEDTIPQEQPEATVETAEEDTTNETDTPLQGGIEINEVTESAETTDLTEPMNSEEGNETTSEPTIETAPETPATPNDSTNLNNAINRVEATTVAPPITEGEELSKDIPSESPQPTVEGGSMQAVPEQQAQTNETMNDEQTKAAAALQNAMNAPVDMAQASAPQVAAESMPKSVQAMTMPTSTEQPSNIAMDANAPAVNMQEQSSMQMQNQPAQMPAPMQGETMPSTLENHDMSKHNANELPNLEAPNQSSGGGMAGSGGGVGKPEGTGAIQNKPEETPRDKKVAPNVDSGISSILGVVGIAVVLAAIVLFLFFTFVITPDEGSIFYVVREAVNSLL
ncbi:hypothetical protein KC669_04600 [Candidatus Dojkabacteria bacterium]|uniref:Uncharacterized protein n=1 Tax=Candidatus Dojkabacteria bacterium TaxID=2099670 RepID=A0A955LBR1_9BACT|nr:hypothetical protein [Candidatus Dojkabacteria bacterium]